MCFVFGLESSSWFNHGGDYKFLCCPKEEASSALVANSLASWRLAREVQLRKAKVWIKNRRFGNVKSFKFLRLLASDCSKFEQLPPASRASGFYYEKMFGFINFPTIDSVLVGKS